MIPGGQVFPYLAQLEQGVFFYREVKVGDERTTCVVQTIIYRTIQFHDDNLKTILLFY